MSRFRHSPSTPAPKKMTCSISIAVCSHNPDMRLLARLLDSIQALHSLDHVDKVVIVDNNSYPPLSDDPLVLHFLEQLPQATCIRESEPGLTAARCRAIAETNTDVVVFFDDDNEPEPDYLTVLLEAFESHPDIAVWGPGTINVEFMDPTSAEIRSRPEMFQERSSGFVFLCSSGAWNAHCPNGTGFAVRRRVLESYSSAVELGRLRTTDRLGQTLSSGGDIQIVWEAFKLEMGAGLLPSLKCHHLITDKKCNLNYLKRLHFSTSSSYFPALMESCPDQVHKWSFPRPRVSMVKLLIAYLRLICRHFFRPRCTIDHDIWFASMLGSCYGQSIAFGDPNEKIIRMAADFLGYI